MGAYKHISTTFQNEYKERNTLLRVKIAQWTSESAVERLQRPTNIARARKLGYKAKQGVVVVRVKVKGGLRKRQKPAGGRKPSKSGRFFSFEKSLQSVAEERAAKKFTNCEVLNSYYVGEGNNLKFFEVIMLDRTSPSIINDKEYAYLLNQNNRAARGLTSSGRKHRGLLHKGFGTERVRPSTRSASSRRAE